MANVLQFGKVEFHNTMEMGETDFPMMTGWESNGNTPVLKISLHLCHYLIRHDA